MALPYLLGCFHVRDDTIGDNEKNKVLVASGKGLGKLGHMLDDGREVGGLKELHPIDAELVSIQNPWGEALGSNIYTLFHGGDTIIKK